MTPEEADRRTAEIIAPLRGNGLVQALNIIDRLNADNASIEEIHLQLQIHVDTILGPEQEERVDHVFKCPHCEEETDWLSCSMETKGWDTGGARATHIVGLTEEQFDGMDIDWDRGDTEWAPNAVREWECSQCNHALTFTEIQANTRERRRMVQNRRHVFVQRPIQMLDVNRIQTRLHPDENHFNVLEGNRGDYRHGGEDVPEAFSPEVISAYIRPRDPYAYSLTAECTKCDHSFMIGPEDSELMCPKCDNEFKVKPKQHFPDPQNADERRRRYAAGFGTPATAINQ